MKQNKKGFTLMELLGVIIILSTLLLIVLPSIINSVKNSESDIDETTEKIIFNAADLYISDNENDFNFTVHSKYCIYISDLVNEQYLKSPIKYDGLDDITDTYSIKVTYDGDKVYKLIDTESCLEPTYIAKETPTTGMVPSVDEVTGNILPGSEFEVKVSDEIGYLTFFVLSNDSDYVNLIAEQNITIDGNFTSELQDNDEWYVITSSSGDNRYGPQKAYTYLSTATSNWTNIPIIESFTYLDEGNQSNSSYGYQGITTTLDSESGNYITTITPLSSSYGEPVTYTNMRARLPYVSEITTNTSCTTSSGSCPLWIANYLYTSSYYSEDSGKVNSTDANAGYWTLSSYSGFSNIARGVLYHGNVNYDYTHGSDFGLRPVITVLKSELLSVMQ